MTREFLATGFLPFSFFLGLLDDRPDDGDLSGRKRGVSRRLQPRRLAADLGGRRGAFWRLQPQLVTSRRGNCPCMGRRRGGPGGFVDLASVLLSTLLIRPLRLVVASIGLHPRGRGARGTGVGVVPVPWPPPPSPISASAFDLPRLPKLSGSSRLPALPVVSRIIFFYVVIPPWGLWPRVTGLLSSQAFPRSPGLLPPSVGRVGVPAVVFLLPSPLLGVAT
jgi:hypothetical protein